MTMESTAIDETTGRVINDSLRKYQLPRAHNVPERFHIKLLGRPNDSFGAIYSSKSTGEPPFMLGAGTYLAIKDAVLSSREGSEGFKKAFQPPLIPLTVTKAVKELAAQ